MRQLHGHSPVALSSTPRVLKRTIEPSGELREAHVGQIVVGIDLGMSSCSMSYCINNADPVQNVELNRGCIIIPTVLLLRKLDCRVEYIGNMAKEAKNDFSEQLSDRQFHYFELNMLYGYKVSTAIE